MKNRIFLLALPMLALLSACEETPPTPDPPAVSGVNLSFSSSFAGTPISYNKDFYTKGNSEDIMFTNWGLILSEVSLVREDDSRELLGDGYLWVDFKSGRTSFDYDQSIPAGNYKAIHVKLGLDSAVNHGDPTQWPAGHPLNGFVSGLHWGWSGGYIFQAIDGNWRNTGETKTSGFSFHDATLPMVREFEWAFPSTVELSANGAEVKVVFKAEKLFDGVNSIVLKTKAVSHSAGASEIVLMNKLLENMSQVMTVSSVNKR
ncbi:MAG: hypothetical protein O3C22_06490 [Bacteroidetes bacterium]|nr:hypothetical protein [Bacteroidota bacterium]MDA0943558.1 hypothetical protein [Bacteroidota bacterium]MDA1111821.1 hypothetical protein [Bacteroidota bacterium]